MTAELRSYLSTDILRRIGAKPCLRLRPFNCSSFFCLKDKVTARVFADIFFIGAESALKHLLGELILDALLDGSSERPCPVYGARPLRRAIQQRIEDKLSEQMLEGRFSPDKKYVCEYSGGDFVFETKE